MVARWIKRQARRPATVWLTIGAACAAVLAGILYLLQTPPTGVAARPSSEETVESRTDRLPVTPGAVPARSATGASDLVDVHVFGEAGFGYPADDRVFQVPEDDGMQAMSLLQPAHALIPATLPAAHLPALPELEVGAGGPLLLPAMEGIGEQNASLDGLNAGDPAPRAAGPYDGSGANEAKPIARILDLRAAGSARGAAARIGVRLTFGADGPADGAPSDPANGTADLDATGVLGGAGGLAGSGGIGGLGGATSAVGGSAGALTGD